MLAPSYGKRRRVATRPSLQAPHVHETVLLEDRGQIGLGDVVCERAVAEYARRVVCRRQCLVPFDDAIVAVLGAVGMKWGAEIVRRFKPLEHLHRLEVCHKPASPFIRVLTRTKPSKQIPVTQLSDGQKHTIFLTMAMLAESNDPLIIDQPEDDLDNAFIFSSVVKTLRQIKERRQVILVTHNANIAVLGDSELLFAMRRSGEAGAAFERGSIDEPTTKVAVQDVLEGGSEAFLRRKAMYNL